jgi:hypothetical protein
MAELQVLPPGYQSGIDEAQFKKRLAAALMASGGQQRAGQMVGNRYVPTSGWENASQLAKTLVGAYGLYAGEKQQSDTLAKYGTDQQVDLARILKMQLPQQETIPGGPGEGDAGISSITRPGDVRGAETAGLGSQFPRSQDLGQALQKARLLAEEKRREELLKRVRLSDIQGGNLEGGAPKAEYSVTEGVPYAKSETGIAPLGTYKQGTMSGADGRPMAVQTAPFTGRVDAIDKAPKVNVNTGKQPEDKYIDTAQVELSKKDTSLYNAAEMADMGNKSLSRIRDIIKTSPTTGGPLAQYEVAARNFAAEYGIPFDPAKDASNARLSAEFSSRVADMVLTGGRGISNDDRVALEKALPSFASGIPFEQVPAFINQLEKINNSRIGSWRSRYDTLPEKYKQLYPATFGSYRGSLAPSSGGQKPVSEMNAQELDAYEAEVRARGRK